MRSFWDRQPPALKYVFPRLVAFALGWLALTIATFTLLFVANDPVDRYLPRAAPQEQRDEAHHALGLDEPAYRTYWNWLSDFARGDFGTDLLRHRSISPEVRHKAQPTIELLLVSIVLGGAAGFALNSLRRRSQWSRRASLVATSVAGSLPVVVVAIFVIVIPADYWGYGGSLGFHRITDDPWRNVRQAALPASLIALAVAPFVAIDLDRWRGYGGSRAVLFSALRSVPLAISGVIVAEQIFNVPGLGLYVLIATESGDDFLMQSLLGIFAAVALFVWLVPPRPHEAPLQVASSIAWDDWIRSPLAIIALALVGAFIFFGVVGPWIAPYGPFDYRAGVPHQTPSSAHLLGTDRLGNDELSRILYGARAALKLLGGIIAFGLVPGVLVGVALRRAPQSVARAVDELRSVWWSLPWLVVLLALSIEYAPDLKPAAIALGLGAFVTGAASTRSISFSDPAPWRARAREVAGPVIAHAASIAALVILADVTMSFVGFTEVRTSWGVDLSNGRVFPFPYGLLGVLGAVICGVLFAFNLLAASVADYGEREPEIDGSLENLAPEGPKFMEIRPQLK